MRSGKQISIAWYAVSDYVTAAAAWICFIFIQQWMLKEMNDESTSLPVHSVFWLKVLLIPAGWLLFYAVLGSYHSLYKKSRLFEFTSTFVCSLLGTIILFFLFIVNHKVSDNAYYYFAFLSLLALHFIFIFTGRWIILNMAKKQLLKGTVYFNTLMIGSQENAVRIFKETEKNMHNDGYRYAGFVTPNDNSKNGILKFIPKLGHINQLEKIIDENN
ncbi:MAG TPA: hypothetical protein VET23_06865, partial [Chitinophagaceae bacterium]|nr:hypothetical protein [Chitinophagaceae bacterium]